ncbi:hypothetical protein [Tengunoibacter tsumagoiensis]|uniref:Uncharacterized protein n=1 Tax=Tengunoibacter tsumagoiensis TaxID=2014871 RepID=A0A402A6F2_9CHLR|nr:hypothetical protein [Tengunoibacter tsumagoiensis]GCE14595.1 hypothetical protein KTT_44540 [Tengunoibacter tsumagoiensis]
MQSSFHYPHALAQTEAVTCIRTPPYPLQWGRRVRVLLELHGCTFINEGSSCLIEFPTMTIKQEIWPRALCVRYLITLPDGYQIMEEQPPGEGYSSLGFSESDLIKPP